MTRRALAIDALGNVEESGGASVSQTGLSQAEPSSTVSALTGFDPSRWLNMATAPRDGSIFLARGLNWGTGPEYHYVYAQWTDCEFVDANDGATTLLYLTEWFDAARRSIGRAA